MLTIVELGNEKKSKKTKTPVSKKRKRKVEVESDDESDVGVESEDEDEVDQLDDDHDFVPRTRGDTLPLLTPKKSRLDDSPSTITTTRTSARSSPLKKKSRVVIEIESPP